MTCVQDVGTRSYLTCRYILDDVNRLWSQYDKDDDGFTTMDEFKDTMFGKIKGK